MPPQGPKCIVMCRRNCCFVNYPFRGDLWINPDLKDVGRYVIWRDTVVRNRINKIDADIVPGIYGIYPN